MMGERENCQSLVYSSEGKNLEMCSQNGYNQNYYENTYYNIIPLKLRNKQRYFEKEFDANIMDYSKYCRLEDVISSSQTENDFIVYNDLQNYHSNVTVNDPQIPEEQLENCKDIKIPKSNFPIAPNVGINFIDNNAFDKISVTSIPDSVHTLSHSKANSVKIDEIYPISKGEIHKISEKKSDFDHNALNDSTHQSATIINCPLVNTYGARLLTKMGWRFGEGLGKDRDGIVSAVRFEKKIDRLGLASATEKFQCKVKKSDPDKNPVSILMEFCQKSKLSPPIYTDVEVVGPTNMRQFRISVTLLNNTYVTTDLYKTKKEARAGSASIAAKALNLL